MTQYPKRLIEVDLPIKRISAHARREKSIWHGHISTLHIWWARRPLAACRAVICAALWPDPADADCPVAFREAAAKILLDFARKVTKDSKLANDHCSPENFKAWRKLAAAKGSPSPGGEGRGEGGRSTNFLWLRSALLDFIADFANWDNSTVREYLDTSRALTVIAHNALTNPDFKLPPDFQIINQNSEFINSLPRPLVVDPFAGGGSIPLEALRVGADAFASDLNPVPVLLNKVVLEYIPRYGQRLADEVRKWGEWIKREAEKELAEFYPKDADGAKPIAYLWARTIQCEGPGCGAEVPLIRSLWLAKKANRSVALQLVPNQKAKRVDFQIIVQQRGAWVCQSDPKAKIDDPKFDGTVKGGSATCPCCGYTTPKTRLRVQLCSRSGGASDARLFAVVVHIREHQGRHFRIPNADDHTAIEKAKRALIELQSCSTSSLSPVPHELIPHEKVWKNNPIRVHLYGMRTWGDLFAPRQALALATLVDALKRMPEGVSPSNENGLSEAVRVCLALAINKQADSNSSLCSWRSTSEDVGHTFGRQALPMFWDFVEPNIFSGATRDWSNAVEGGLKTLQGLDFDSVGGHAAHCSAASHPLPDDSCSAFVTDPPYYDAVPYGNLSDFFYVWLKRTMPRSLQGLFEAELTPKEEECVVDDAKGKDHAFYEKLMTRALAEGRRVLMPAGIGVVVFAHKSTSGWEAVLQAVIDAGWIITGSWPIDTEMSSRLRAKDSAALASSVHLVCRPRPEAEAAQSQIANQKSEILNSVGDWRDVLQELPRRIHEWMPRLAEEGVVGADAIFACLGPALEIFSRYSRVEKASGEAVTLKEFLEQVWAAVAKEALTMIFTGADATGFEEDARLTAMWLWTLSADRQALNAGTNGQDLQDEQDSEEESEGNPDNSVNPVKKISGFILEYDAARKIAQGLGAHLEDLSSLVEVSGETARLLPVGERARHLFGKDEGKGASRAGPSSQRKKREPQMDLFKVLDQDEEGGTTFGLPAGQAGETKVERRGETVLDRIHQSMILFAAGRSEALKRFLVEDGAGRDQRFWRLAQALSALYPSHTEEKRWVDGVLARKKGLGF